MMRSKKLWGLVGAATLVAAAFASAAIASDSAAETSDGASVAKQGAPITGAVTMVAAVVRDAIAGDADAAVMRAQRAGLEPRGLAKKDGGDAAVISAAKRVNAPGTVGTVGVRPGWGCGDTNHTHSGPPGRPGATPPPGCNR